MDLVAEAKLPISFDDLGEALRSFVRYARDYAINAAATKVHLSLHENGAARNRILAKALPSDARAFVLGPSLDMRKIIIAGEFLAQTETSPPTRTFIHAELTDFLSFDQSCAMLDQLAGTLPSSGRGITLMIQFSGVKLRQAPENVHAEFQFNLFQSRPSLKSAMLWIYCPTQSRTDRAAKKTIIQIGEALDLKFGKTRLQQSASDAQPDPAVLFTAYKAFQSAFDLATNEIDTLGLALDSVPLLFSRYGAATKRFADIQQGIREQVDLVPHLKRFMRENQPAYEFEQADSECVTFRKKLAPQLEMLLNFERHHLHGIGKSFGLQFGVDYPGTPDINQPPIHHLFREDFFTLFHKNWEQRAWAYATKEELQRALGGCRKLLVSALPLLENKIVAALLPLPTTQPPSIPSLGPLTAREAYAHALPIARKWAADAELVSISSNQNPALGTLLGPGVGFD